MKISAFSLSGIKAKQDFEIQFNNQKTNISQENFPIEHFDVTDMLEYWNKFSKKLEENGQMILHTLMQINTPRLDGTVIIHKLPSENTKEEFEKSKPEILGFLRKNLQNYNISIDIEVNENPNNLRAYTPLEKYNRLKELNPNLEMLKNTFDLDF